MSYTTPWPRVYNKISGLPANQLKRLTVELPIADAQAIISVACNPAVYSLICQTALKQTAEYVRNNKLTYENNKQLIDYICGRPDLGAFREVSTLHDAGRTESVLDGAENAAEVTASVGKKVTSGSGSGGGGNVVGSREKIRQAVARVKAKSGRHDEGNGDVTT